ncbi:Trihelix transcription factor ENAP2-like protein [Drosera capensis]
MAQAPRPSVNPRAWFRPGNTSIHTFSFMMTTSISRPHNSRPAQLPHRFLSFPLINHSLSPPQILPPILRSSTGESLTHPATAMMVTPSSSPLHPRPSPVRDDCWSPEATATLIKAWGQRYVETKHGNLRQKHWQEVADIVNACHAIGSSSPRHRICRCQEVTPPSASISPPMGVPLLYPRRMTPFPVVPLAAMVPQKRPAASVALSSPDEGYFRENYSAIAAAAAAAEETEDEDDAGDGLDDSRSSGEMTGGESDGFRKLATAIERFSEVYARVEGEKQRQMVELERQRMQFAQEMECQRMQMLVEMLVQLEKVKRAKRSNGSNEAMEVWLYSRLSPSSVACCPSFSVSVLLVLSVFFVWNLRMHYKPSYGDGFWSLINWVYGWKSYNGFTHLDELSKTGTAFVQREMLLKFVKVSYLFIPV